MDRGHHNDRIIYNGNDLSSLVMCRFERPLMPPIANTYEDVAGRHGAIFKTSRMSAYTLPVTIWLREEDRHEIAAIRRKVASLLYSDSPAPLYLPDEPDKYYLAIVDGDTSLGEIVNEIPETVVNFLICDPIAYGQKREADVASGATRRIEVGGTWKTYPVITVTPTATSGVRVTNTTTAEFVELAGSVSTSASYVIDMELERATLNGSTVGVTAASDFFSIEDETTISAANCVAHIEWRERWL